ncbi:MAG: hypothetical protein ABIJ56_08735 [Pseudomonadota bacterium]
MQRFISPLVRKTAVSAILVLLCLFAVITGREARLQRLAVSHPEKIHFIPIPEWSRAICVGYTEAAADLAWIRALIYFGEETGKSGHFEYLDSHNELILGLNPMFQRAYMWAGVTAIYSSGIITRKDVEKAIEYLKRGVEKFPYDGNMQYMLGFDLYFELPQFLADVNDEEGIRKAKLEGIEHFKKAIVAGNQPEWLAGLVSSLLKKNGHVELAIKSLEDNLKFMEDPEKQKQLLARLAQLKGERDMGEYQKEMMELHKRWSTDYAYLPLDMFLLVEPKSLTNLPPFSSLTTETDTAMDILDQLSITQTQTETGM